MADIKCPKHGAPLRISLEHLKINGKKYTCVVGDCPICECRYIDQKISSSDTFRYHGISYMFLDALNDITVSSDDGSVHEANHLYFSEKLPRKCPNDNGTIIKMKRVSFQMEGYTMTTSAFFCPKCRTVFFNRIQRPKLRDYVHIMKSQNLAPASHFSSPKHPSENSPNALSKTKVTPTAHSTDKNHYKLARIPLLDSPQLTCPYCKQALNDNVYVKYPSYHGDGTVVTKYANLWECRRCQAVFADQAQFSSLRSWNEGTRFETVSALQYGSAAQMMTAASRTTAQEAALGKSLPFADYGKETENLSDGSRVVQVYAKKCHCQKCQSRYQRDTMVNRTAIVETVRSGEVRINVMFCKGCGQYFVSLPALEQYRELYGGLLMEFKPASDLSVEDCGRFNFAPDTILSRCGYSVKSGITPEYRHAVLRYILESGKAQKYEIIEKISGFIRLRDRNPIFSNACERWREDIQFVSNYRIGQQKSVRGLTFKKG